MFGGIDGQAGYGIQRQRAAVGMQAIGFDVAENSNPDVHGHSPRPF
jgi:hypothetical protein